MGKLNDFLIELAHIASTLDRIERNTRIQDRKRWSEQLVDGPPFYLHYHGRRHLLLNPPTTFDLVTKEETVVTQTIVANQWNRVYFNDGTEYTTSGLGTNFASRTVVQFLATDEGAPV